jgi:hypothetical protein
LYLSNLWKFLMLKEKGMETEFLPKLRCRWVDVETPWHSPLDTICNVLALAAAWPLPASMLFHEPRNIILRVSDIESLNTDSILSVGDCTETIVQDGSRKSTAVSPKSAQRMNTKKKRSRTLNPKKSSGNPNCSSKHAAAQGSLFERLCWVDFAFAARICKPLKGFFQSSLNLSQLGLRERKFHFWIQKQNLWILQETSECVVF